MFAEELSVFLADFGEPATSTRDGVEVASFTAIFDSPDLSGTVGTIQVNARERLLLCRESDAEALRDNADTGGPDTVTVRGENYFLIEKHPDGTGMVTLVLSPAPESED